MIRLTDQLFPMLMLRILEFHYDPRKKAAKSRDIELLKELTKVSKFAKVMLGYCYAMYMAVPDTKGLGKLFYDNLYYLKYECPPQGVVYAWGLQGLYAYASPKGKSDLHGMLHNLSSFFEEKKQREFAQEFSNKQLALFNYLIFHATEKLPLIKEHSSFKIANQAIIKNGRLEPPCGNELLNNIIKENPFKKAKDQVKKAEKEKAELQQKLQALNPTYVPPQPSAPPQTVPPTAVPSLANSPTHSRHASVVEPLYPDLNNNTVSTSIENNDDFAEAVFESGSKSISISASDLLALRDAIPINNNQNSNYFGSLVGIVHQPTLDGIVAARKTTPEKIDFSDDSTNTSPEKLVTPVNAELVTVVNEIVNDQAENSALLNNTKPLDSEELVLLFQLKTTSTTTSNNSIPSPSDRVSLYGGFSKMVKAKNSIKTSTQTTVPDEKISVLRQQIISACETGTLDDIESNVEQLRAVEDELNVNTNTVDKIARLNDKIKDLVAKIKVDCESANCEGIVEKSQQLKQLKKELTLWESLRQVLSADISGRDSDHEIQHEVLDKKRRNSFSV